MRPTKPVEVVIGFEAGIPVSLDGKKMGPVELVETIDQIGGSYGFGRIDMVENRLVGIKSREVYEAAGSLSLIKAHGELGGPHLHPRAAALQDSIDQRMTELIYDGLWFSPLADCSARLHRPEPAARDRRCAPPLLQGHLQRRRPALAELAVRGRLATYGSGDTFSHQSAVGFIELWGLPVEVYARRHQGLL